MNSCHILFCFRTITNFNNFSDISLHLLKLKQPISIVSGLAGGLDFNLISALAKKTMQFG